MNIVGLGEAGCRISHYLSRYDVYKTFQVDTKNKRYKNFCKVKKQSDHEAYERNYSSLGLDLTPGPVTIVLSGAGAISGLVLRLLQDLEEREIKVLYIKPRESEISSLQSTRHKIVNQILQQYCRSKRLSEFTMLDNSRIEEIIPNLSLTDYWSPINQLIGDTFHMINFFKMDEPLLKSNNKIPDTARISTFSLVDFKSMQEQKLYDLSFPRAKSYYFALGEQFIKENKNVLTEVREFISSKQDEKCDCSYQIHQTQYEQNYVYGYHYASFIQEQEEKLFTD
jgi:hypothetical protein